MNMLNGVGVSEGPPGAGGGGGGLMSMGGGFLSPAGLQPPKPPKPPSKLAGMISLTTPTRCHRKPPLAPPPLPKPLHLPHMTSVACRFSSARWLRGDTLLSISRKRRALGDGLL